MACRRPDTPRSDTKSVGELAEPLRSRIATAIGDCPHGLVLMSGYRDPGRQWDLRHERCPGRECDRSCRGYPVTAVPYASRHQTREAADMGGTGLSWLIARRAAYGLGLTVRSENWHFEAAGVDTRTGRRIGAPPVPIRPYSTGPTTPAPITPTPTPGGLSVSDVQTILARLDQVDRQLDTLERAINSVRGDGWRILAALDPLAKTAQDTQSRVASMHQGDYGEGTDAAGGSLGWLDRRLAWQDIRIAKAVQVIVDGRATVKVDGPPPTVEA